MLRRLNSNSPQAEALRKIMGQGNLIPDDVMNRMVDERLQSPDCRNGFVLDGYPRTRGQAAHLEDLLSRNGTRMVVLSIVVGYNEIIRRTTGRRLCPKCGTIYNIYAKPPRVENACDLDGTPLVIRADDREEVIRERVQAYENQTRPVIEYLREKGEPIYEINGSQPPEQISEQLLRILRAA
jgi:adenylate kinase